MTGAAVLEIRSDNTASGCLQQLEHTADEVPSVKRLRDEVLEFSIAPQGRGREARGEQAFEPGCRAIACGIVVMPSSGPGSRISAIIGAKGCASIRCTRDLGSTSGLQRREIKHILNRIRCLVPDARLIDEPLACRNESDARFHGTFTTPPDSTPEST